MQLYAFLTIPLRIKGVAKRYDYQLMQKINTNKTNHVTPPFPVLHACIIHYR